LSGAWAGDALIEAVVQVRNAAVSRLAGASGDPGDPAAMQQLSGSESALTQSLGHLFTLREAHPDPQADQAMMQLSIELTEVALAGRGLHRFRSHPKQPSRVAPASFLAPSHRFAAADRCS
jgi:LemA protein